MKDYAVFPDGSREALSRRSCSNLYTYWILGFFVLATSHACADDVLSVSFIDEKPTLSLSLSARSDPAAPLTPLQRCTNLTDRNWSTIVWLPADQTIWVDESAPELPDTVFYHLGHFAPARIADRIWEDLDGDGNQDAGEPGIPDVVVNLTGLDFDANAVLLMTSTGSNGGYEFADLEPGSYRVAIRAPEHFQFTHQDALGVDEKNDSDADIESGLTDYVLLAPGVNRDDVDAGLFVPGSIHGYTFEDINGNGIHDWSTDPFLPGVPVELQGDGIASRENTSDANGEYTFTRLNPRTYRIVPLIPGGSVPTTPMPQSAALQSRQSLVALDGQSMINFPEPRYEVNVGSTLAFGFAYLGSLHGYAYLDSNHDGTHDAMEPTLSDVRVALHKDNVQTSSQFTKGDGSFSFTDLPPSSYTVVLTSLDGLEPLSSSPRVITVNSRENLVALAGQSGLAQDDPGYEVVVGATLAFGFVQP